MKPGSDKIFARADRALARAVEHMSSGAVDRALERAYHAIVYAARAVLNEEGESARSHELILERLSVLTRPRPRATYDAMVAALRLREASEVPSLDDCAALIGAAHSAVAEARVRVLGDRVEQGENNDRSYQSDSGE